ncbi:unnamed protein product [Darwinula stevensoni]|uniref:Dynamin stalk domain-containing protein n=1 Tax=Darwinula stevensoni TaxID=69355 RepID=A0A7R9A2K8_9CRUS|nr:unnamed protein product [Darwinula stevensoni]CAG0889898.1 unnamed protein product [Darwinula stevensoni]
MRQHLMDRVGTRVLQNILNRQLEEHIREKLPGIRSNMMQKRSNLQEQLQILGAFDTKTKTNNAIFHQVMVRFANSLKLSLEGFDYNVDIHEVQLGVVINETINEEIINGLLNEENLMPTKEETMTAIRNLVGVQNYMSPPQQAFRRMVTYMTKKFKDPMKTSVELIADHTGRAVEKYASQEVGSFPNLKQEVLTLVMEKLKRNELACKELLVMYIEAECSFMNTNHPLMKRNDVFTGQAHGVNNGFSRSETDEGKVPHAATGTLPRPPRGTQRIHEGYLHLPSESAFSKRKRLVWFTITPVHITIFKDSREDTELIRLNNAEIRISVKNDSKKSRKKFTISKVDGRSLGMGQARDIEFFDEDRPDSVMMRRPRTMIQPQKIDFARKFESDKTLKKDAENFMEEILKYMRIVKQTIQDLTPKYIVFNLIDKDKLMEPGGDEELKKRHLMTVFKATEEALEIINGLSWPGTSTA